MSIWEIKGDEENKQIAFITTEGSVILYNTLLRKISCQFPSPYDSGSFNRMCIVPDGKYLITGAYERKGISCFMLPEGELYWHNKDIKKIQKIKPFPQNENCVLFLFDSGPSIVYNYVKDSIELKLPRVKDIYGNIYNKQEWLLVYDKKICFIDSNKKETILKKNHSLNPFVLNDVAFNEKFIFIIDPFIGIQSFHKSSSNLKWTLNKDGNEIFLRIFYSVAINTIICIANHEAENKSVNQIIFIDPENGEIKKRIECPFSLDFYYANKREQIYFNSGDFYDITNSTFSDIEVIKNVQF